MTPVKAVLNHVGQVKFFIPGLQDSILKPDGSLLAIKPFDFNFLSSAGTAVIIAGFISLPIVGLRLRDGFKIFAATLTQLKFTIITVGSIVGFAFVANNSGMSITIATALAGTGVLFPFFSPILGWLGVFLTGSNTSSNALFCKLQYTSAEAIGVDPVLTVSANASGGVVGKMISPQSLAVGSAAVGIVGKESQLFRFTLKHSFILLLVICIITVVQAYLFPASIPQYELSEAISGPVKSGLSNGIIYLSVVAAVVFIFGTFIYLVNKKNVQQSV
jgi:lactate permease